MMQYHDMELEELGVISGDRLEALKKEKIYTCLQLLFAPNHVIEKYFNERERREVFLKIEQLFPGIYRFTDIGGKPIVVSTGVCGLDEALGGGIRSSNITEVCSERRYLRTLFAYSITLNFIREFENAMVVYNDLSQTFRPERLCELARHRGFKDDSFLEKVFVFKPYTVSQQFEIFDTLEGGGREEVKRLLIVDGVGDFFKPSSKRKDIAFHSIRMLESFILRLNHVSVKKNMIVLLLNSLVKNFDTNVIEPQFNPITQEAAGARILFYEEGDVVRAKVIIGENVKDVRLNVTDYGLSDAV